MTVTLSEQVEAEQIKLDGNEKGQRIWRIETERSVSSRLRQGATPLP